MKRAAIVTGMTAGGVALVLAYKVTPHSRARLAPSPARTFRIASAMSRCRWW